MTCGGSSVVIDGEEEREDFKAMELYLESPFNVDVDIMPPSEVEKLFRAFAEERKRALPQFTPDGIPITMENKFDDAIYNYLYEYWKEQSGEYDPKKDVIPESEMNKMHPKTKNEFQFENWLFEKYGMTKKEERGYTVKGNLESLWEIFSAADMVLFVRGLPSIGKELAQLGKKAVDDVAEEAIEKTVKTEVTEEMAENTAKKEMVDTTEDLSQKVVDKEDILSDNNIVKKKSGVLKNNLNSDLIHELVNSGVKCNIDDVVAITKMPNGKLVWLENGNSNAGLKHIMNHAEQFATQGISNEKIPDFLMHALSEGKVVGMQRTRVIYEVFYEGSLRRVAISVGNNGFIVGANPKSIP